GRDGRCSHEFKRDPSTLLHESTEGMEVHAHIDAISWASMMQVYAWSGLAPEVVKLFEMMKKTKVQPNHYTLIAVLTAYKNTGLVEEGMGLLKRDRAEDAVAGLKCIILRESTFESHLGFLYIISGSKVVLLCFNFIFFATVEDQVPKQSGT
ncbi:hypothetical protein ACJX0J_033018, partial [Zea mays]